MKLIRVDGAGHGFGQKSETWHKIRAGKFTGSEISDLCAKKGIGQTGITYIEKVISEGRTMHFDFIETPAMRWGNENEPIARQLWQKLSGKTVEEIPFIIHDKYDFCGISLDGINLFDKFFIEIKCPYTIQGHLKNLQIENQDELKAVRPEYYWQMQFGLWVTDFDLTYYISFDPRWQDECIYQIKVERNEFDIALLESRINEAQEIRNNILKKAKLHKLITRENDKN